MLGKINSLSTADNGKFYSVQGKGEAIAMKEEAW